MFGKVQGTLDFIRKEMTKKFIIQQRERQTDATIRKQPLMSWEALQRGKYCCRTSFCAVYQSQIMNYAIWSHRKQAKIK